jgi:hypothetical protein
VATCTCPRRKPELLQRQAQRPLTADEAYRLFDLQEAARARDKWETLVNQKEREIELRRDTGGHVKVPGAAGVKRRVGIYRRETRQP